MSSEPGRLRIAYLADWDASDETAMSGASFHMRKAFAELGHEVVDVFPTSEGFGAKLALAQGVLPWMLSSFRGQYYSPKRSPAYVSAASRVAKRKLRAGGAVDYIFSQSALAVGALTSELPIMMTADQTFESFVAGYKANASELFIRQGLALERDVVRRARRLIYPSEWACNRFRQSYPDQAHKADCLPWGANLMQEPSADDVLAWIRQKTGRLPLRLLFIGRDWERKGGPIVLESLDRLREAGVEAELHVVGSALDIPAGRSDITVTPSLNKRTEAGWRQFRELMASAHLLFVPSRAEAYGHVFCEAAAFGVPSVTAAAGGIPSIIQDGVNGVLLPLDAPATAFASRIASLMGDAGAYVRMAEQARATYLARLSWRAFAVRASEMMRADLAVSGAEGLARGHAPSSQHAVGNPDADCAAVLQA